MSSVTIVDEPAIGGLVARSGRLGGPLVLATVLVAVAAPAAAQGGYFPTSWGWTALALGWLAAVAAALRPELRPGASALATLGAWVGFAVLTALSALWSADLPQTAFEAQRALVPVAALLAALACLRAADVGRVAGGVAAATTVVAAYAVATRCFPGEVGTFDSFAGYRLAAPFGYWNGLGVFAAIGALVAAGCAARARSTAARAAASAAPVLLVTALYFTFSRGAWLALALGLAAAFALDSRRFQLLAALVPAAVATVAAVALASRADSLTRRGAALGDAASAGRGLALALLVLAAAAALGTAALCRLEARLGPGIRVRRVAGTAVAAVLLGGAALLVATLGGPAEIARDARASFTSAPVRVAPGEDLNRRLFSLSSSGRVELWGAALDLAAEHRLLGAGAGSYEQHWLERRASPLKVRDAHSLYLETLAELGPAGLLLLAVALGLPLAAAVRARRHPLVPPAAGAYAAYLAHAGVDWDWELSALTVTAVLLAAALLLADGRARRRRDARRPLLVLAAVTAAAGLAGLAGNLPLAAAEDAARAGDWAAAEGHARAAAARAPWSAAALQALADAEAAQGRRGDARATLRRALALAPRDWALWYDLGTVGRGAERRRAYERALELNPLGANVGVLRLLGYGPVTEPAARR